MAQASKDQTVTGIILIVLGALALGGWLNGIVIVVAGIAALVYGILILMRKTSGSQVIGIICIVAGLLLLLGLIPFLGSVIRIAVVVIGVVLIVVGILKLLGKM